MPFEISSGEIADRREWRRAITITLAFQVLLWWLVSHWQVDLPEPVEPLPLVVSVDLQRGKALLPESEQATPSGVAEAEDLLEDAETAVLPPTPEEDAAAVENSAHEPGIDSADSPVDPAKPEHPRPLGRVLPLVEVSAFPDAGQPTGDAIEPAGPPRRARREPALPQTRVLPPSGPPDPFSGRPPSQQGRSALLPELPAVPLPNPQPGNVSDASIQVAGPAAFRTLDRKVVPVFPAGVRRSAKVTLRFVVREDGSVGGIEPEQRVDPRFEEAAIQALREWRFAAEEGREDRGTVTFIFTLVKTAVQ